MSHCAVFIVIGLQMSLRLNFDLKNLVVTHTHVLTHTGENIRTLTFRRHSFSHLHVKHILRREIRKGGGAES